MTNDQKRRASGQAMQDSRRAGGKAMIERRTGKSQVDEINAVVVPPRSRQTLKTVNPRGALPAQTGTGHYQAPPATGGGAIASPLAAQSRTFSAEPVYVETFDGAGLFRVKAVDTLTLLDADNREVLITGLAFEPPVTPTP
ncbi:hypothetical protein [uncultured Pseudomonas sp.]|uniref:hypothetical protein n=1 Tax=uncultured Pseudomonas sp. TaxID=114707 RepID=UPI002616CD0D|nr:hypothetical protein [uncultured Pseudomonas sp.]